MEEDSNGRAPTPQLLDLIQDDREWKMTEAGAGESSSRTTSSDAEEDRKLELKLGLPGVHDEERPAGTEEKIEQHQESYTALSLGCFATHPKLTANTAAATGAKRGFLATVDTKPEGCNQRQQESERCGNELTLGGENVAGERKKGCCPPSSSHDAAAGPMQGSSSHQQARGAVLPVVGWPPVRSFRRNLTNGGSSKQSPERQNDEAGEEKPISRRSPLVKINMDGIPIGRKIDLAAYDSHQMLSSAVEELFRGFLEAQKDLACTKIEDAGAEEKIFSGLLDGTGEYTLVYEDNGGGRTLAGNLPWNVFVSTAKRLRVMRSSELPNGLSTDASGRVADQ